VIRSPSRRNRITVRTACRLNQSLASTGANGGGGSRPSLRDGTAAEGESKPRNIGYRDATTPEKS